MSAVQNFKSAPLTNSALGVYLECMENPSSVMYNILFSVDLPLSTDIKRFKEAVKTVVEAHPSLMVNLKVVNGVPSFVQANHEIKIEEIETDDTEKEISGFARPFDLENDPLFRFAVIRSEKKTVFVFDIHHTVFDGTSLKVFVNQIKEAYLTGKCEAEKTTIFDVGVAEAKLPDTPEYKKAQEFFKEKFDGAECDLKPATDIFEEVEFSVAEGVVSLDCSDRINEKEITDFAKKLGVNENAVFTGAFAYAMAKFAGGLETFFCTANHGRRSKDYQNTFGIFVKTMPLYFSIDENCSVADFLKYTYDYYYQTKINSIVSFGELAASYGVNDSISFVYQTDLFEPITFLEGEMVITYRCPPETQLDWDMMLMKSAGSYSILSHYRKSAYSGKFVESFCRFFVNIVCGILKAEKLGDIPLVSDENMAEYAKINSTEAEICSEKTVVDLFREQVAKTPDNICLVYKENRYTYSEVDRITDILAENLVKKGVGREKVVGVLIPRNEYMLICSLGVLKAGGAYLPLDPTYPPERLNLMVKDSGAMLLLYDKSLADVIGEDFAGERICTDEIKNMKDISVNLESPKPEDLFVMLYTSGSTGLPKGVMFEHSNTLVTTEWVKKHFEIDEASRVTVYASYGFDAHAFDIYPAITSGAELHIIGEDIRLDFPLLKDYFNNNGITHTVMTMQVGRQFALMGGLTTLKHLSVAGEKLTPLDKPENFKFYNLYGPTEGSIITSAFLMDKKYKDVPIGYAVDNLKTYVVDKKGKLLPIGAVGELWIAGPHVTRGYLNRPEKQAEAYGENTFEKIEGYERIYRTGDIVRLCADGNLQFVGRRDAQVKVRGFRVELTEIEEVIRRFEGIKDATVAAFDASSGGKFIAAYVVSDNTVDTEALADFIRSEKPPYMVPAVTMQIDKIPLNQNSKVNKKALPLPEFKAQDTTPPENDTQKAIFDMISEIIGHTSYGVDTDIFEAGLTSIGSIKLAVALSDKFGAPIKIKDIKENETVRKLEKFFGALVETKTYEKMEDYPLTETQKGILTECLANAGSTAYNIPLLLKIGEGIELSRLNDAVKAAINAHPFVKQKLFADKNGDIRAKRCDDEEANSVIIEREPDFDKLIRPFAILGDTLYRCEIYKGEKANYLFMDFHHIISDGTSENILLDDIQKAYDGVTLTAESYSGYEVALDEEAARKTEAYNTAKAHYDSVFAGVDSECMPQKAPEENPSGAASVTVCADTDFGAVKEYCDKNGLTPNAFFNAAFGFTLARFGYKEDTVFATVYNGRNDSRTAHTVAMLVKTLPVALCTDGKIKIKDAVKSLGNQLMNSMANDIYSFAEISRAYGINADVIFVYQGEDFNFSTLCGEKAEMIKLQSSTEKAPLSLCVYIKNGKITADAEYSTEVYCKDFIESFLNSFSAAVKEFLKKETFAEVSLLNGFAEERYEILNDNDTEIRDIPCFEFVDEFAAKTPDKTAVISAGRSLTFGSLADISNRIANALIKKGVTKNTIIGMVLDRGVEVYTCELGIMKAGGAFLPMLPTYPDERIDFCLTNAESPLVVTTAEILSQKGDLFTPDKPYKTVTVEELLETEESSAPGIKINPDDMAYCIYTSGSTGTPKGVMIKHHNLSNFVQTHQYTINFLSDATATGSMLSMSSISFDMSIYEIMLPICAGKTASMATEEEIHNPIALISLLENANVEDITCTPTFITNMMGIPEFARQISRLKSITVGAEAFPPTLYDTLKRVAPDLQIINGYGPTECTICCSEKELHSGKNVTIGRPSRNCKMFVMDKFGNILPPFAAGELIICGDYVGGGYIKLPEKNAASFFNVRGLPAYHSGDLVRLDGNSEIAFTGRIDNQIKLRGFRIELDEIEKVTCSYEGVRQSKVLVRNNGTEDYLVGFFTADKQVDIADLTAHLKSRLTYYMVPAVLMQLEKMPLTPNGKIDKNGFPEVQKVSVKRERKAAKKSLEQRLCEIFAEVLNTDEIYADDNFFELGGTSISASKVTMLLMSENIEVKYGDIFDNPTPEALALFIEQQRLPVAKSANDTVSQNGQKTREALKYNMVKYAAEVQRKPLGNVLLTGAVGFLGVHILKELLEIENGHIYCLVRKGSFESAEIRLKTMLVYYFSNGFTEELKNRITVLDADITDKDLEKTFQNIQFDTVINCAACVKHFADDDILDRINVHGVENLINLCQKRDVKLIQISTVSIPGLHTEESYEKQVRMHENELFVIDDMSNKYCISKYNAELRMFDAIENGMRGKVIRVGNLMGRHSDGEFQVNMETNMFMSGIRGFAVMGKYPISHMTDPMSFSPVDCTARAVVMLAGTNDKFTAFNCNSRYGFDEMKIIDACNRNGITILPEKDEIYYEEFRQKLGNDDINAKLGGLAAYDIKDAHAVDTDNLFTTNILYRIGFSWPLIDDGYLDRTIYSIMTLDYFDIEEN
ncbi:MAG: amino acid adenylation domain-containing protein [Clostridiales bacterium]|nr:amino acid adenylation domain-containing protein [Candidatus Equinaster intestinalis]